MKKGNLDNLFEPNQTISRVGFTCCIDCGKCIWLYLQLGVNIFWDELITLIEQDRGIEPEIDEIYNQELVLNTCTLQNMQQNINDLSTAIAKATDDKNNLKGRNIGAYHVTNNGDLIFLTQLGNNIFIHLIENGQWKAKSNNKQAETKHGRKTPTRRTKQSVGNPS